jgi:hypothetical protein
MLPFFYVKRRIKKTQKPSSGKEEKKLLKPAITDEKKGCARIVWFFAAQPLPMIRREPGWVRWEQAKALLQNCVAPGPSAD